MNPVLIRIFDVKRSKVVTDHFFNMCIIEGEDWCKAFKIFEAIEQCFVEDDMPWSYCVSLSVDNTNSMIGRNNSVASRFLEKNSATFIAGCPCHLAHIAASHANESFSNFVNFVWKMSVLTVTTGLTKALKEKENFLNTSNFAIKSTNLC